MFYSEEAINNLSVIAFTLRLFTLIILKYFFLDDNLFLFRDDACFDSYERLGADRGRDPALYCFARLYSALYCPLYSLSHVPSLNITPMPRPIRGQCGSSRPIRGQFLHPSPTSWAGQGVGI